MKNADAIRTDKVKRNFVLLIRSATNIKFKLGVRGTNVHKRLFNTDRVDKKHSIASLNCFGSDIGN